MCMLHGFLVILILVLIEYNKLADSFAKNTAHDICIERLFATRIVSFAEAVKLSIDITKKIVARQTKRNLEVSGAYTRYFN